MQDESRDGGDNGRSLVVVGASAGGVEALTRLVRRLPGDLDAAVLVVLHVGPTGSSVLPNILGRAGDLPAEHVEDSDAIEHGRIYVAPPDRHMLVEDGRIRLSRGPKEHGHRPAIDPLFRTAARSFGSGVVGVVLSGTRDDGSAGLLAVRRHGGATLVQDPDDALYGDMPANAARVADPDHVLAVEAIATKIAGLIDGARPSMENPRSAAAVEHAAVTDDPPDVAREPLFGELQEVGSGEEPPGETSPFTCPDCNGTLWEVRDGLLSRFRCRVGHAYSPDSLLAAQGSSLEGALWGGIRALEERVALLRRLADQLAERGVRRQHFDLRVRDGEMHAKVLRQLLESSEALTHPGTDTVADLGLQDRT